MRILCIEDKNEIIGIAPLRQSRLGFIGPFGFDVVEPLGTRGLMPEGADYTGFMLVERKADCLRMIFNHLVEYDDWDFIYLTDVPETSVIPNLLTEASRDIPLKFELEKGAFCYYLPLPNSNEMLLRELGKKPRNNLRRCMRNLEKDFQNVKLKGYHEFGSVEEAMKIHFDLNQKRWKSRNMRGAFNTQEVRDFYIDVAKVFADRGWLALYFLAINDEPIAGLYSFEYDKKMLAAVSGFDPDYIRYSVGNLLHWKVIEKSIEKGLKEYDFLKGDETYKSYWTAKYRRNLKITFVNKKFNSRLYNLGIRTIKKSKINKLLERSLTYS
jgi:CelD/BcsL family acetyltransferase involved in cellulose biosynthesis